MSFIRFRRARLHMYVSIIVGELEKKKKKGALSGFDFLLISHWLRLVFRAPSHRDRGGGSGEKGTGDVARGGKRVIRKEKSPGGKCDYSGRQKDGMKAEHP